MQASALKIFMKIIVHVKIMSWTQGGGVDLIEIAVHVFLCF